MYDSCSDPAAEMLQCSDTTENVSTNNQLSKKKRLHCKTFWKNKILMLMPSLNDDYNNY